jgi:hypothetical protein
VDTAACLKRTNGRIPTVLVSLQDANELNAASVTPNQLFQAASSFWSPTALQLLPTVASSNRLLQPRDDNEDEVVVSYWNVNLATKKETLAAFTVLQNLDREQRIVWDAAGK